MAPSQRPFEYALNVLRLREGFRLEDFEARCGLDRSAIAEPLDRARRNGWLHEQGDRIVTTALGERFTNDVMELFLQDDEPARDPDPATHR